MRSVDPSTGGKRAIKFVREVLDDKGHTVWSVAPDAPVLDALRQMAERNIGALLVVDGSDVVGVFSERDYAREVADKESVSVDTPVAELMTDLVVSVEPDQTVRDCMSLMTEHRVRHLPVFDGDELVGVVSIGDAVKATIDHQQFKIEQLESYIRQGG